jgi:hypothetical protein
MYSWMNFYFLENTIFKKIKIRNSIFELENRKRTHMGASRNSYLN